MSNPRAVRVLIVDDDEQFRSLCRRRLHRSHVGTFCVSEATDGATAVEALRHEKFDCVLVDHGLPDTNGTRLISRLRQDSANKAPIILMSAEDLIEIETDVRSCGAIKFVAKHEISAIGLDQIIQTHVQKHRSNSGFENAVSG